jgi:hypothetical protein
VRFLLVNFGFAGVIILFGAYLVHLVNYVGKREMQDSPHAVLVFRRAKYIVITILALSALWGVSAAIYSIADMHH